MGPRNLGVMHRDPSACVAVRPCASANLRSLVARPEHVEAFCGANYRNPFHLIMTAQVLEAEDLCP